MGKYIMCLSFMIGIGTELHGMKENKINFFTVNVLCETHYVNYLHCF